jgi:hypothetical protein
MTAARVQEACERLGITAPDLLSLYFGRFVLPYGKNEAVLADFVGFFQTFYSPVRDYGDEASRLLGWLRIVEQCAEEQRAFYQQYYLDYFVPEEHRHRLLVESQQKGALLPGIVLPTAPPEEVPVSPPPAEQAAPAPSEDLFALTGLPRDETAAVISVKSLGKRLSGMLCSVAGGLAGAALIGAFKLSGPQALLLLLFLPVIVVLAESMALQSLALALAARRQPASEEKHLPRLGRELLMATLVGIACGVIVLGVALVCGWQRMLALSFGLSTTAAMAGASGVSLGLAALLARLRQESRLPAGLLARALATLVAVAIYFTLAFALARTFLR